MFYFEICKKRITFAEKSIMRYWRIYIVCFLLSNVLQTTIAKTFHYNQADSAIWSAIQDSIIPGAVLCVVEKGNITYMKAYGNRSIIPTRETMSTKTIFDLASLSKPLGAGSAALLLIEKGKLHADDMVCHYINDYHADISIRHLMTHYSGLPAYMNAVRLDSIYQSKKSNTERTDFMIDTIGSCKRPSKVGEKYRYSCLNFISLQRVVETIVEQDINTYMRDELYKCLGNNTMGWLPADSLIERIAPTECADDICLRGEVHDPLARIMMEGISGNAGIFATAEEVANWSIWFMNLPATLKEDGCYAGLWVDSITTSTGESVLRCRHTGYTGTSITILPEEKRAVILLTNRVHPKDQHSLGTLRKELNNLLVY